MLSPGLNGLWLFSSFNFHSNLMRHYEFTNKETETEIMPLAQDYTASKGGGRGGPQVCSVQSTLRPQTKAPARPSPLLAPQHLVCIASGGSYLTLAGTAARVVMSPPPAVPQIPQRIGQPHLPTSEPYTSFQAQRRGCINAPWFELATETGCLHEDPCAK